MARRKRTLREESDALLVKYGSLMKARKNQLHVYVESLNERMVSAQYALSQATRYSEGIPSTEVYSPFAGRTQKRDFYSDAFWAFSYSCFDILAHIANMIYPVVKDEAKIGFRWAANDYKDLGQRHRFQGANIPKRVVASMAKVVKARKFARLACYRQCCLHRRAVCVLEETTTRELSTAYLQTTAIHQPQVVATICDDPNSIHPKFAKKRSIDEEFRDILEFVEEKTTAILRLL